MAQAIAVEVLVAEVLLLEAEVAVVLEAEVLAVIGKLHPNEIEKGFSARRNFLIILDIQNVDLIWCYIKSFNPKSALCFAIYSCFSCVTLF